MANKKDEFSKGTNQKDEFDFDALDNDLDMDMGDDFDGASDKQKGKRNPITSTAKDIAKEVVSPETLKEIGSKIGTKFGAIGSAYDSTIDTISDLDAYKSEVMRNIGPTINQVKRASRLYLPKMEGMLPKSLYAKLDKITQAKEDFSAQTEAQVRDATISASIAEIFKTQQDINKQQYLQSKTDEMISTKLQVGQHIESTNVMFQIRNLIKLNQRFMEGTFRKYLMKSLELKYKMLFLTKDILDKNTLQTEILSSKLEAIKINTGLPDIVKRHKSEEFKGAMRERLYGKAVTTIGDATAGFRKNLMANVKKKVVDEFSGAFNEVVGGSSDLAEQAHEMSEADAEMGVKVKSPLAKMVTFLVRKALVNTGSVGIEAGVGGQKFKDINTTVKGFMDSLPHRLQEVAESRDDLLGSALKLFLPTKDTQVDNMLTKDGTGDVSFDVITRRSIIEIIPGFLAKINQHTEMTSKALGFYINKVYPKSRKAYDQAVDTEEQVFDRDSEDFMGVSEFKEKTLTNLLGSKDSRNDDLTDLVSKLYSGHRKHTGDNTKFKEAFPAVMRFISNLSKHDQIVHPNRILKYLKGAELTEIEQIYLDKVLEDIPEDSRAELAEVLTSTFYKDVEKGDLDKNVQDDTQDLFRRVAVQQDEYKKKLGDFNAFGGKRFSSGVLRSATDKELEPEIAKLKDEFISKYGRPKFERDNAIQLEFRKRVDQLKAGRGIDENKVRSINEDVDQDLLLDKASKNYKGISENWHERDKSRDVASNKTAMERITEAIGSDFDEKLKPIKNAIDKWMPESAKKALAKAEAEAKLYAYRNDLPEDFNAAKDRAKEGVNSLVDKAKGTEAYKSAKTAADDLTDKVKGSEAYTNTKAKANSLVDKAKGTEAYKNAKSKVEAVKSQFSSSITPDQASDISDDTGIPNRDEVQLSGPGVYFQGAKRELHIPLDGAVKDTVDKLRKVKDDAKLATGTKLKEIKGRAKKSAEWNIAELQLYAYQNGLPSTPDELDAVIKTKTQELKETVTKRTVDVKARFNKAKDVISKASGQSAEWNIAELQLFAYQNGLPSSPEELKTVLDTKSKELKEIVAKRTDDVKAMFAKTKVDVKKSAEWNIAELQLFAYQNGLPSTPEALKTALDTKSQELRDMASKRTADVKARFNKAKDVISKASGQSAEWNIAELQLFAYQNGLPSTPEELKTVLDTKSKELKEIVAKRTDDVKAMFAKTKADVKKSAEWNIAELQLYAYQHGLPETPEALKAVIQTKSKELQSIVAKRSAEAKALFTKTKAGATKSAEWNIAELQLFAYQNGLPSTPDELNKVLQTKAKALQESATKLRDKAKGKVNEHLTSLDNWAVSSGNKAKAQGAINSGKDKIGALVDIMTKQLNEAKATASDAITGLTQSPDQSILAEIKELLVKQFETANEFDTVKLNVANQMLMNMSRGEIMANGDPAAKRQIGAMGRLMSFPGKMMGGLGRGLGKGARAVGGAYIKGTLSFYKGLFGLTTRMVPKMITAGGKTVGAGLGAAGNILPAAGNLIGKGLKAYYSMLGGAAEGILKGTLGIGKIGTGLIKKLFTPKEEFPDVYRKDEVDLGKPLIKGIDAKKGMYVTGDGKVLPDTITIKGPVFDAKTKQLVVTSDDLKHGLVDYKNEDLNKGGSLAGLGFTLLKKGAQAYGKFLLGTAKLGMTAVGGVAKGIGRIFGGGKKGKGVTDESVPHLEKLVQLVTDIKKLVTPKTEREGGYTDYFRDKEARESKRKLRAQRIAEARAGAGGAGAGGAGALALLAAGGKGGKGGPGGAPGETGIVQKVVNYATGGSVGVMGANYLRKKMGWLTKGEKAAEALKATEALKTGSNVVKAGGTATDALKSSKFAGNVAGAADDAAKDLKNATQAKPGFLSRSMTAAKDKGAALIDAAKNTKLGSAVSSKLDAAKDVATKGITAVKDSKAGKWASKSASAIAKSPIGKFVSSKAGKMAGMSIGKKVLVGAAGAGAAVASAPVAAAIGTALAVAGVVDTGLTLYDWARGSGKRKQLAQLRNEAYHVPEDKLKVLIKYEDALAEYMNDEAGMPADEANDFIKDFGLDPKDTKHYEYFRYWYLETFYPIFQLTIDILGEKFGIKFDKQTELHNDQLKEYQQLLVNSDEFQQLKANGSGLTVAEADAHDVETESEATKQKVKSTVELPKPAEAKTMAKVETKTWLGSAKSKLGDMKDSTMEGIATVKRTYNNVVGNDAGGEAVGGPLRPGGSKAPTDWKGPYGSGSGKYNNLANQAAYNASAIETYGGTMPDRPGSQYHGEFQIGDDMRKELGLSDSDMNNRELVRAKVVAKYEAFASQLQKDGIPPTEAALYTAWQQGLAGYKQIYKAAQSGGEVSSKIRANMEANRPHVAGGKLRPGASPAEWLAGWENNTVANLNGGTNAAVASSGSVDSKATTPAASSPSAVPAASAVAGPIAATSPIMQPMAPAQQTTPVEKALGAWPEAKQAPQKETAAKMQAPSDAQQVALLSEQNNLLKEMTSLLGGINKNTEADPNAPKDKSLVARLDSLIDVLGSKSGGKQGNMVASGGRPASQSPVKSGGINVAREQYAS